MHQPVDNPRRHTTAHDQIHKALAEARRARHHRDCHCRLFDRQFCNAADALWQRALNRELEQLYGSSDAEQEYPS